MGVSLDHHQDENNKLIEQEHQNGSNDLLLSRDSSSSSPEAPSSPSKLELRRSGSPVKGTRLEYAPQEESLLNRDSRAVARSELNLVRH